MTHARHRLSRLPGTQFAYAALRNAPYRIPHLPEQANLWLRARVALRAYPVLDETALRRTRRSDTVFVFGSGASLNDVPEAHWSLFAAHDTLGFNWFVHQQFVRADYHLVRGIPDTDFDRRVWEPQLRQYFELIRENQLFGKTIFLLQTGLRATNGNRALALRLLPTDRRVFLWRTRTGRSSPSQSLAHGLTHAHSTLDECVNFAYLLGWKRIVLVGVDLYDRQYFWLPRGATRSVDLRRGATAASPHHRARSGMVETLSAWGRVFREAGVSLEVYNPQSLLVGALPLFDPATLTTL